jgi:hypothetical protein
MNSILITVTGIETGDTYYSRSYPDNDYDNNGKKEFYSTPVYKITIENEANKLQKKEWKALRFMPYWNDPKSPSTQYKAKGWVNSGLSVVDRKKVTLYDKDYTVHNTTSLYKGAIQIQGNFLIHAGPTSITNYGWGAAGCVEIITKNLHDSMLSLVKSGKLFVEVQYALRPNLKNNFYLEQ